MSEREFAVICFLKLFAALFALLCPLSLSLPFLSVSEQLGPKANIRGR